MTVRQLTPAVRPDDILAALRQLSALEPVSPPLVTRLWQGPMSALTAAQTGAQPGMTAACDATGPDGLSSSRQQARLRQPSRALESGTPHRTRRRRRMPPAISAPKACRTRGRNGRTRFPGTKNTCQEAQQTRQCSRRRRAPDRRQPASCVRTNSSCAARRASPLACAPGSPTEEIARMLEIEPTNRQSESNETSEGAGQSQSAQPPVKAASGADYCAVPGGA